MAANITLSEAAFLSETLLPYLTVDFAGTRTGRPMGNVIRSLFRRWSKPMVSSINLGSLRAEMIDWQEAIDGVLRPLILDAVKRSRGTRGNPPEDYDL